MVVGTENETPIITATRIRLELSPQGVVMLERRHEVLPTENTRLWRSS